MKESRSAKKPTAASTVAEPAVPTTTELDLPEDGGIRLELPGFEGPLDLLLHLIQEHELDILNIPIAFITKKYLEYIGLMQVLNIDIASEYLVMSATLAHIKSRMLLPTPPADLEEGDEDELDPRAELIRRLLEYQKYKKAGEELAARSVLGRDIFVRGALPAADPTTAPLAPVSSFKLLEAFQRILARAKIVVDHQIEFERFSLSDRINQLVDLLKDQGRVLFDALFEGQRNRADVIVTFLALLELTRLRMTRLFQDGPLAPIFVELSVTDGEDSPHVWEDGGAMEGTKEKPVESPPPSDRPVETQTPPPTDTDRVEVSVPCDTGVDLEELERPSPPTTVVPEEEPSGADAVAHDSEPAALEVSPLQAELPEEEPSGADDNDAPSFGPAVTAALQPESLEESPEESPVEMAGSESSDPKDSDQELGAPDSFVSPSESNEAAPEPLETTTDLTIELGEASTHDDDPNASHEAPPIASDAPADSDESADVPAAVDEVASELEIVEVHQASKPNQIAAADSAPIGKDDAEIETTMAEPDSEEAPRDPSSVLPSNAGEVAFETTHENALEVVLEQACGERKQGFEDTYTPTERPDAPSTPPGVELPPTALVEAVESLAIEVPPNLDVEQSPTGGAIPREAETDADADADAELK